MQVKFEFEVVVVDKNAEPPDVTAVKFGDGIMDMCVFVLVELVRSGFGLFGAAKKEQLATFSEAAIRWLRRGNLW